MADRFFPNDLPDFVPESDDDDASTIAGDGGSPLLSLLHLPYPKTAQRFLRFAVDLKDKVVNETWLGSGRLVKGYSLYTGALGTAFLLFKSYQVTGNVSDLRLCNEIVRACDSASKGLPNVTFIAGRAGVCAVGAVVAKHSGEEAMLNHYLRSFREIKLPPGIPNELLYGRAGYLWACSYLNKHIGEGTIPSARTVPIAKEMISEGRKLCEKGSSPLMYEWHGTKYWGAAHGLAGITHVLMDMDLNQEEREYLKGTLCYMTKRSFPSGNYPVTEGDAADHLVHWCHGAPGVALTLNKAALVFNEEQFLRAAADAAEVVWNRGLLKRVGLCHGVSGNAYVFLSLFRSTGHAEYLYRAKAFACFLLDRAEQLISQGKMHGGDCPYSLFEGQAGLAYLFFDMVVPSESRFPAYEL